MNYPGPDRSEIQFATQELGKEMISPNHGSWLKLKRLLRHLRGNPTYRWLFGCQEKERNVVAWSNGDFARCIKPRKSVPAGVIRLGDDTIKAWSAN